MQVLWFERARVDVRELFDYLLERNPGAARRVAAAIENQVEELADHPAIGRPGRVISARVSW